MLTRSALPLFILPALALTAACHGGGAAHRTVAEATANGARQLRVSEDQYEFAYAYPASAGAIPALKAWLDADLERQRADIATQATAGQADARGQDRPFNAYSRTIAWKEFANLPGWLSLAGSFEDFTGGAHPNHGPLALLWDKRANRRRAPLELFVSKAALSAAIRAPFCDALDKQRAEKRRAPVDRKSGNEFDACIDPAEQTLLPGSTNHTSFDQLRIQIAPYEAGPYVEGDYSVALPVTQAVLDAVRPEFRTAFALAK